MNTPNPKIKLLGELAQKRPEVSRDYLLSVGFTGQLITKFEKQGLLSKISRGLYRIQIPEAPSVQAEVVSEE